MSPSPGTSSLHFDSTNAVTEPNGPLHGPDSLSRGSNDELGWSLRDAEGAARLHGSEDRRMGGDGFGGAAESNDGRGHARPNDLVNAVKTPNGVTLTRPEGADDSGYAVRDRLEATRRIERRPDRNGLNGGQLSNGVQGLPESNNHETEDGGGYFRARLADRTPSTLAPLAETPSSPDLPSSSSLSFDIVPTPIADDRNLGGSRTTTMAPWPAGSSNSEPSGSRTTSFDASRPHTHVQNGHAWPVADRYAASQHKGKDRALPDREGPPRNVEPDPLDPLSAMRLTPSASASAIVSLSQSVSSRRLAQQRNGNRPPDPPLRPPDPPSPSSGSYSHPSSYPSNDSLYSSSPRASSRASGSTSRTRPDSHQPSLQQLLQEVDLGAALKLVQGLQSQQQLQSRLNSTVANGTPANSATPAAGATVQPAAAPKALDHPNAGDLANSSTMVDFGPLAGRGEAREQESRAHGDAARSGTPEKPGADRRSSLMGGLQKRLRTTSSFGRSASTGQSGGSEIAGRLERFPLSNPASPIGAKPRKRVENALTTEQARTLDEQISRVHLTLSPSTLQRAQNCAKYITLRYTPVFAALSGGVPPPNPLDVARWRARRREEDKHARRVELARGAGVRGRHGRGQSVDYGEASTTGANRLSTLGSIKAGMGPSPFGPRRNKNPKVWELYPDDLADYVASEGRTAADDRDMQDVRGEDWRRGKYVQIDVDSLFRHPTSTRWGPAPAQPSIQQQPSPYMSASPPQMSPSSIANSVERDALVLPASSARSAAMSSQSSINEPRSRSPATPVSQSLAAMASQRSLEGAPVTRASKSAGVPFDGFPKSPLRRTTSLTAAVTGISQLRQRDLQRNGNIGTSPNPDKADLVENSVDSTRNGLSRQLDRMRNRPLDASRETSRSRIADQAVPEHVLTSPTRRTASPLPVASRSGTISDSSRRPTGANGRKHPVSVDLPRAGGFESDTMIRSSGDEGSARGAGSRIGARAAWVRARRGILGGAWQNLKSTIDNYPDPNAPPSPRSRLGSAYFQNGEYGALACQDKANAATCVLPVGNEDDDPFDSEDENERHPPREVVDLPEDDYTRLTGLSKQVRADANYLEETMQERVVALNRFLHLLVQHAESSAAEMRTSPNVVSPRLPASVLADVAFVKDPDRASTPSRAQTEDDAADDSDISSDSSSSDSDDDWSTSSSSSSSHIARKKPTSISRRSSAQVATLSRRTPRRRESEVGLHAQMLSSPDPVARIGGGRPRSHTLAVPTAAVRTLRRPTISQAPTDLKQRREELRSAEPLVVLGRSLRDLEAAADELERDAAVVVRKQEGVDTRINKVLERVNEVQQKIDREDFQRLRVLEDHYFRLRTALSRPSTSLDFLWTGLSYVLILLFWLSWLVVTVFRTIRSIVLLPFTALRWLLFLG